jgi:hypothetical protein
MLNGRLATVIIQRKWADAASKPEGAYHLPAAVVDYVNNVQRVGVYARHELPPKALQAYHADYYLAQVNNGGHSQFIGNSGALLRDIAADALAGLEAMDAKAQHRILTEMMAWAEANPEEAGAQIGFDVRAKLLDELDSRFYAAERETPMTPLAANWIAGWPELRIVEDGQYSAIIDQIAALNPFLGPRRIWKNVESIRYQLTDKLRIGIAAACGAVEPEPEAKTGVGGGSYEEIEGQQCLAFWVVTQKGERLCVVDDEGARLYEYIHQSPPPKFGPGLKLEDIRNYKPPVVGARLSAVSAGTIQQFVKVANETQAPEALDLLLRKAELNPAAMITAWKALNGEAIWIAVTGQRLAVARTFPGGAELKDHEGRPIAVITRADIERHSAEAAAAAATMRAPV